VGLLSYGENDTDIPPQPTSRPGEIDNRKLVSEENSMGSEEQELQRTLREGEDYTLVPEEVWRKLYNWYAIAVQCDVCIFLFLDSPFNASSRRSSGRPVISPLSSCLLD
jgi:hypothetical protein